MLKNKKTLIAIIVLVVLVLALLAVWHFFGPQSNVFHGEKTITVTVYHKDGNPKDFTITTKSEYLRGALDEQRLVAGEEGEFGLFVKAVDGETANDSNEEWWCLTKGGGFVSTSVDETPIQDGDCFELTFTVGYDF